ncbi:patatin-like phospholipase family protein [Pedobacter montanisoli]|uniref:Patatin-like phospholipase family protein n=1 Tax=Pedobacter montanisoli TaxID=2923277 RepID=A0ABS9ZYD8_9SPHI|nr:patatin-like phospholipase family protein [Pedobacter montanisoli]MCJ0743311.1 patatin-like phospholipase family protein [Pedobacter montanisoli]
MRFLFVLVILSFNLNIGHAQKVGLVFSGGGAKGLAHIGTLKALEENNIPVDYITGTSMGAIVGGLYAAGYSPSQIEKIALSKDFQDWVNGRYTSDYSFYFQKNPPNASSINAKLNIDTGLRLSFRSSLINDIPLNFALLELFSQASAIAKDNFNQLFVPYRCMVSDVLSQKSITMSKGSLADAVRASMTVPLIYRPIRINDKLYFDGGIYNNFPADVMQKEFSPDIIIGANVSSKTYNEYPKNDDRLMNRLLMYMFLAKSDSTLVGKEGIYIEPNLSDYSSTNFVPVAEIIQKGYEATMANMEQIKKHVQRRVNPQELLQKRIEFNERKSDLIFSDVAVYGVNSQQKKYIERLFKSDQPNFNLDDIKRGYYKLVADETFESVYPKIFYDDIRDSYIFEIYARPKKSFKIDFGGNISTRPISNVFLGIQYNYINKKAYTFGANFYSGRFYEAAQLNGRVDFPSKLPIFLASEITFNHWNYYNTSQIFIENPKPVYIEQTDRKIDLKLGVPLNKNSRLVLNSAFIYNSNYYSPNNTFAVGDILDKTSFSGFNTGLTFEKNSLNRKQYATAGKYIYASFNVNHGRENYTPGNIFQHILPLQVPSPLTHHYKNWVNVKLSYENYFLRIKNYNLAAFAEAVLSNQELSNNYYATLLQAPTFYPLQDSRSIFLENFKAHTYGSVGLKNVFTLKRNLDLRLEGYVFMPHKAFAKIGLQEVAYQQPFEKIYYAATTGLVYQSPLGPISLSYNYYDDERKRHGVLFHIGYLIYNKKSLE